MIIAGLEAARGTTANGSNLELLVDLMVQDLIHQILNGGIKISRVLLMVGIKQQLGLCEGRICDAIQEMIDPSTGVIGSMIGLLCQGQHQVSVEFINTNLSLGPLHNALKFLEASCIVFCSFAGIKFQGGLHILSGNVQQHI